MRGSLSDGTYVCACGRSVPDGELVLIDGRQKVAGCMGCALSPENAQHRARVDSLDAESAARQVFDIHDAEQEFARRGGM